MEYQVTPKQYSRLVEVKNNWPGKLSFLWENPVGGGKCVLAYLTSAADLNGGIFPVYINRHNEHRFEPLSDEYGIPLGVLGELYRANVYLKFGSRRRSKAVLTRFQGFLDDVVVPEPSEISELPDVVELERAA